MTKAKAGIAIMNSRETTHLPHSRRRPAASRLLQELDLQFQESEERLEAGLKMEIAFSMSQALSDLFRAGLRSRGFEALEIERLFNTARR